MLTPAANFAVDPDQTVPRRAVKFGLNLFATKTSYRQTNIANRVQPHFLPQRGLMGRYLRKMQLMLTSMANISVQTNIWDPDQTAPRRSGSTLIATKTSFNNELVDNIWVVR